MRQSKINKKVTLVIIITACILLWFPADICRARIITVEFTAEVTVVYESIFEGKIEVGDTITGTYTYDTSVPSSTQPESRYGYYEFSSPPAGVMIHAGGFTFKTDPNNVDLIVKVENNFPAVVGGKDRFDIASGKNLMFYEDVQNTEIIVDRISIFLDDYTEYSYPPHPLIALLSRELPAIAPNLDDWTKRDVEFFGEMNQSPYKSFYIKGRLTSATLISDPPKIIYVNDDAPGANDGSSWENAYVFLQDALASARGHLTVDANDSSKPVEIRVAQGFYQPDMGAGQTPGDRETTFNLINQVAIKGGYAGLSGPNPEVQNIQLYKTILTGDLNYDDVPGFINRNDNSYHVVSANDVDESAYIEGFVITSGNADGLPENNPDPSQRRDDHSIRGGGLYIYNGRPIIKGCTFKDNFAYGYGGGLYLYGASRILNCNFIGNKAENTGGAIFAEEDTHLRGGVLLKGCLLQGNIADRGGTLYGPDTTFYLLNCTLTDNRSNFEYEYLYISCYNCIVWNNNPEMRIVYSSWYSDIDDTTAANHFNISEDPLFAAPGYWNQNDTPDDPNDDYWIEGDYHLKSQAGRYDPNTQTWVQDDVTSPCIDAGDPMSPIGLESFPNGGIINMGAYGGTAEASKSYFDEPVCETIVAGDINGDCKVDFKDFAILSDHWLK